MTLDIMTALGVVEATFKSSRTWLYNCFGFDLLNIVILINISRMCMLLRKLPQC